MILTPTKERRLKMYRGTTPPIIITFPQGFDVSQFTTAYLSFSQFGTKKLEKELSEMTVDPVTNSISVSLTQQETLNFVTGIDVHFQMRFILDGEAYATQEWTETIEHIIKDGVI